MDVLNVQTKSFDIFNYIFDIKIVLGFLFNSNYLGGLFVLNNDMK